MLLCAVRLCPLGMLGRILCWKILWCKNTFVLSQRAGYHSLLDIRLVHFSVLVLHNGVVWYTIVWYTIHGGPGQGDYLLCRGWNGFSGGAEPAEVSNHYIHPHSGFTQLCVELDCWSIIVFCIFHIVRWSLQMLLAYTRAIHSLRFTQMYMDVCAVILSSVFQCIFHIGTCLFLL